MHKSPEYKKYRKKPLIVQAYQSKFPFIVNTLQGVIHAEADDYKVIGTHGEEYSVEKNIFEENYELVED